MRSVAATTATLRGASRATLAPVARQAEHLAVARFGLAALRPWGDVVGFHVTDLEDLGPVEVVRGQAVGAVGGQVWPHAALPSSSLGAVVSIVRLAQDHGMVT